MGELLTVDDVARRLRTNERFVRRLVAERRIRYFKVGKYLRFDASDVDAFVVSGEVRPVVVHWRAGRAVA